MNTGIYRTFIGVGDGSDVVRHCLPQPGAFHFAVFSLVLAIVVPVAIPFLGTVLGASALVRICYPLYTLIISLALVRRWPATYPAFCIAVFAFAPFLRRVADYDAGFVSFNPILLAPYSGLLPSLPSLFKCILRGGKTWPFAVIVGCVVYASFIALFELRIVPAFYEALRWLGPVALAAFVLECRANSQLIRAYMLGALALILPAIGVYGIVQFLNPPVWDIAWMTNVQNATFGQPEPFGVRVFSTMNSPGSMAVYAALGFVIMTGSGWLAMLPALFILPALALSLIRTAWLACAVGLAVMFLVGKPKQRFVIVAAISLVSLGIVAKVGMPVEAQNILQRRLDTFSNLQTDASADDRLEVYRLAGERLANTPLGEGFGANTGTANSGEQRDLPSLDSGILEAYLTFGVPVATLYFVALAALGIQAYRAGPRKLSSERAISLAMVCMVLVLLPLGSDQIGEFGILEWPTVVLLFADSWKSVDEKSNSCAVPAKLLAQSGQEVGG